MKYLFLTATLALTGTMGVHGEQDSKPSVSFEERLLSTIDGGATVSYGQVWFAPDGRTVAYFAAGQKTFLVVGNKKSEPNMALGGGVFSPDAKFFHYFGQKRSENGLYQPFVAMLEAPFDPGQSKMTDDGSLVGAVTFSANGKAYAYEVAPSPDKRYVVVGGVKIDAAQGPALSPDGKLVAYSGWGRSRVSVVAIGSGGGAEKKSDDYQSLLPGIVFSPDGKSFAYRASKTWVKGHCHLVLGSSLNGSGSMGREEYEEIGWPVIFSPDSRVIAYKARTTGSLKEFVVVGEKKGEEFDAVDLLQFSPDGKFVAYAAKKGQQSFVVLGEKSGPAWDNVSDLAFSPDGKTLAYVAQKEGRRFVVTGPAAPGVEGGKKGEEFDNISCLRFGSDGKTIAYAGQMSLMWRMVVGTKKGPEFDAVWPPTFSPDGNKIAYGARKGSELWWKVMDLK